MKYSEDENLKNSLQIVSYDQIKCGNGHRNDRNSINYEYFVLMLIGRIPFKSNASAFKHSCDGEEKSDKHDDLYMIVQKRTIIYTS